MYKRIYVEITNVCNLNCPFCPQTKREKEFMNIENFTTIINKIKNYTNHIYLHIKGEPLMHPNLDEIIKIANKNNLNINITTNGRLLKDKLNIINNNKIRQINISLHSFNSLEEIKDIVELCDNIKNTYINFRLWNDLDNKEILDFLDKHYNVKINRKNSRNNLNNHTFLSVDKKFDWPSLNIPVISTKGTCKALKDQIGILVNGDVVSCCLDNNGDNKLGNIFKQDINEIINSSKYQEILNGFNRRELVSPLCQRCGYRERFK